MGWPEEWPDEPGSGHFVISEPEWVLDTNERIPLQLTEKILIPATDVQMVEFAKWEYNLSPEDLNHNAKHVEKMLANNSERALEEINEEEENE